MERKKEANASSGDDDESDKDLLQKLEQHINWDGQRLVKYNGFWLPLRVFRPIRSAQKHFKAKSTDIILSSIPKSGTTWLMSLAFSIANRNTCPNYIDQSPLLTCHPHTLVPFLEFNLYWDQHNPDLENILNPRIFSTHIPFQILPDSIRESGSKIIYLCRNPLDQFISHRHFLIENKIEQDAVFLALDEAFDLFCEGIHPFGPFWEHILGYWNAHLENPNKVLFLKYEDLKEDINLNVKKIAGFMGCPFSLEEEKQGMVEGIARLCSFGNLKNLEVNKSGDILGVLKKSSFFRKGEVGDWKNYLTPAMAQRINKLLETKFEGSGLVLKY